MQVFDVLGRPVETFVDGTMPADRHTVTWDASDAASGVYFYRLQAGSHSEVKKMILLQ